MKIIGKLPTTCNIIIKCLLQTYKSVCYIRFNFSFFGFLLIHFKANGNFQTKGISLLDSFKITYAADLIKNSRISDGMHAPIKKR